MGKEITNDPKQGENAVAIFSEESIRRTMLTVLEANRQYCFPFSIYTPGNVAPSLTYSDPKISGGSCRVEFLLQASFQRYKAERKIEMLGQALSTAEHPATVVPSVVPVVTKSFSWKKMLETKPRHRRQPSLEVQHHHGCLIWAANVKNTHVCKGELASFSFSLRNNSSYDVVKLTAQLIEKISWKTHKDTFSHATELTSVVLRTPSFVNNHKARLSLRQSQIVSINQELAHEMELELTMKENNVVYEVPSKCRVSYKGKLIQVTHHLLIEAKAADTHGKDHIASMTLEIPLKVFNPSIAEGHSHRLHQVPAPAMAEKLMTKWPHDLEEDSLQASFTSLDDSSWDSLNYVSQIREDENREDESK